MYQVTTSIDEQYYRTYTVRSRLSAINHYLWLAKYLSVHNDLTTEQNVQANAVVNFLLVERRAAWKFWRHRPALHFSLPISDNISMRVSIHAKT